MDDKIKPKKSLVGFNPNVDKKKYITVNIPEEELEKEENKLKEQEEKEEQQEKKQEKKEEAKSWAHKTTLNSGNIKFHEKRETKVDPFAPSVGVVAQTKSENPGIYGNESQLLDDGKKEEENYFTKDVIEEQIKVVKGTGVEKPLVFNAPEGSKKICFKYQIINSSDEKIKGYLDAYSKEEVQVYLENEGYKVIKVEVSKDINIGSRKLKYNELGFMLTQLSTYLKAGISLIDSVRILEKQTTKPTKKQIYSDIVYELVKGESFSNALMAQEKVFPKLLINMVKTAEMTGDLPGILDDMTDYFGSIDRTRKAATSAMIYPIIIFVFSLIVIIYLLTSVIPKFAGMFAENNAELPLITKIVMGISDFLIKRGYIAIIGVAAVVGIFILLFKKVKPFRKTMQTFLMKLPLIKDAIIYREVAMFTKTFASLLNHDVFITDSMEILSKITSNEVYADIISDSLEYLSRGAKISDSFKGKWAFPIVAYEMLQTGENTGRLPIMMDYVAKYYEDLHANYVKRVNTFIEPLMIVFLALMVGTVVLAVIIPMFSFYNQIQ